MPAALSMFGLEWAISDKGRERLEFYIRTAVGS
jgi:hypothetical protein